MTCDGSITVAAIVPGGTGRGTPMDRSMGLETISARMDHPVAPPAVRVVRPRRALELGLNAELWGYRDLLWVLAARDVRVRYKQTLLGAAWALLQPLMMMLVLTVLMGRVLGVERMSDPVYVFAGVLPWTFFAALVTAASASLVNNAHIITKIYFPRLLLPLASGGAPLVDLAMALVVLGGLMAAYGVAPTTGLLLILPLTLTIAVTGLALGVLLAAMTVAYRDLRYVVPFLLQVMFFLSPVLYPLERVPESLRWVATMNPMAALIEQFRAAVTGGPVDGAGWSIAAGLSVAGLLASLVYFGRVERRFADIV